MTKFLFKQFKLGMFLLVGALSIIALMIQLVVMNSTQPVTVTWVGECSYTSVEQHFNLVCGEKELEWYSEFLAYDILANPKAPLICKFSTGNYYAWKNERCWVEIPEES